MQSLAKAISFRYIILVLILTACTPITSDTLGTPPISSDETEVIEPTLTPVPTATTAPYLGVSPEGLNGVEITFLHPWTGATAAALGQLVNDFNQLNEWGVFVDVEDSGGYGLMVDEIENRLETDDPPNLIAAAPAQLAEWQARTGLMIDLNGYINLAALGMSSEFQNDYFPVFFPASEAGTPRYGVPVTRTMQVLFYNRSWARELGFNTRPVTIDQFREQVCAAGQANMQNTNRDDDGTGGWLITTDALTALSWLQTHEFTWNQDFETPEFNTTPAQNAFAYTRELADDGCAWLARNPEPYEYFATRHALIFSASLADLVAQQSIITHLQSTDDWEIIGFPASRADLSVLVDGADFGMFAATAEQQMAAWLFIRWMAEPTAQARLARPENLLPLRQATTAQLSGNAVDLSQWQQAFALLENAQAAPRSAWWAIARPVLADAFWQNFQANTTADQVADTLDVLDATIAEIQRLRSE